MDIQQTNQDNPQVANASANKPKSNRIIQIGSMIVAVIVILLIINYLTFNHFTSHTSTANISQISSPTPNRTLTTAQVISVLGNGWQETQHINPTEPNSPYGNPSYNEQFNNNYTVTLKNWESAVFSNSSSNLTIMWTQYQTPTQAFYIYNATVNGYQPPFTFTGISKTPGTLGGATYTYANLSLAVGYSGGTVEAGEIFAYDGSYTIGAFFQTPNGGNLTMVQAKKLLSEQLGNLNLT